MTDLRTPSDLVTEVIADLEQSLEDLQHEDQRDDPDVWDAVGDVVQGAAGLLSDAAKMKRGTAPIGEATEGEKS